MRFTGVRCFLDCFQSGNWFDHANWSGGVIPNGIDQSAVFSTRPNRSGDFASFGNITLGSLYFDGFYGHTLKNLGTLTFQVSPGNGNAVFTQVLGNGEVANDPIPHGVDILNLDVSNIVLGSSTEFRFNAVPNALVEMPTVSPPISGAKPLVSSGNVGVYLENDNNSYSGGTIILYGIVSGDSIADYGVNSAFGRGNFELRDQGVLQINLAPGSSHSTNRTFLLSNGGGGITARGNGSVLTLRGAISGSGGLGLNGDGISGNGPKFILDAVNTYTGFTSMSDHVRIAASERIPNQSDVIVGPTGTLDLNGFKETIGSLGDLVADGLTPGRVELGSGGHLAVGGGLEEYTEFYGVINGGSTSILEKTGSNSLELNGLNTFNELRISGGTLYGDSIANAGTSSAFGKGNVTRISNGGTLFLLGASQSTNRNVILSNGGGQIGSNSFSTLTWNGAFNGSGNLTKVGFGTLQLAGSNTYTGNTIVSQGRLLFSGAMVQSTGNLVVGVQTGTATLQFLDGSTSAPGKVQYVVVGQAGGGDLLISGGSKLNNAGSGDLGVNAGASGTAKVSGAGSQWNNALTCPQEWNQSLS